MIKRRWTLNDEERIINLLQMNISCKEIAKTLGRTPAAIQCKINELKDQGITPKSKTIVKTSVIDDLGKTKTVLKTEVEPIIKKKITQPKNEVKEIFSSKLTFNLFGENFKIESNKTEELFNSLSSLGQILNKKIEIKFGN